MTVKELINELLDCPMGAEVSVLVEMRRDFMKERLNEESAYAFPVDDDAGVRYVHEVDKSQVRIYLENASDWR